MVNITKKHLALEAFKRAYNSFNNEHMGHEIQYYGDGHSNNFGKLLRVTTKEDSDYYAPIIILWLEGLSFSIKVYEEQYRECKTCKTKRENGK
jgi:hypothetical protein